MTSVGVGGMACREQALRVLDRLPPFSPILNRLLASMAKEDVSFAELGELIEKDTVLAGNVLRLVNSPLYGFRATVNSVRHAVAILGLNKLRNVGLSMSVARMWTHVKTPPGWSTARFNLHSVATGLLADLLAQQSQVPYPEGGFVGGLMHDLGRLLIGIAMPAEYFAVRRLLESGNRTPLECEMEVLATTHAELSGAALERWNLPEPIRRAVTFHHSPDQADEGRPHLSHVVCAADRLANELGQGLAPAPSPPGGAQEVLRMLGLTERLPRTLEQFQAEFDTLKSFF